LDRVNHQIDKSLQYHRAICYILSISTGEECVSNQLALEPVQILNKQKIHQSQRPGASNGLIYILKDHFTRIIQRIHYHAWIHALIHNLVRLNYTGKQCTAPNKVKSLLVASSPMASCDASCFSLSISIGVFMKNNKNLSSLITSKPLQDAISQERLGHKCHKSSLSSSCMNAFKSSPFA
jgi:hypothetical protein